MKLKNPTEPLLFGEALRVAPRRHGRQATQFWKFWAVGSEVYAMVRGHASDAKISVHASGQIHMRHEARDLQKLADPLIIGGGRWLHAFELRFLLSPDTYLPFPEKLKSKQRAFLIDVPEAHVLLLNLMVGSEPCPVDEPLPGELLPGGQPLWRALLRNGHPVLLTARILPIDQQNQDEITFVRQELNPKVSFDKALNKDPYIEVRRAVWSPEGGNVILVVPMGKEAVREPALPTVADPPRQISVAGLDSSIQITAPDGSIVASVELSGSADIVSVRKNVSAEVTIGTLTLSIDPSKLIRGQKFSKSAVHLSGAPLLNGARPKDWEYRIYANFDGENFTIQVRPLFTALRNVNLPVPMSGITDLEELAISAPVSETTLSASIEACVSTASVSMSLLLRDH